MSKWDLRSFDQVIEDQTKRGTKIKKEDYLPQGKFPIIDQGQEVIAGFTNNEEGVYSDTPAIIFGDHTRNIKFINEPFFLGADGVKLLKAKTKEVEYKYLYYLFIKNEIPNTGYNRHFKWLKELIIPVPPLDEQHRIAQTLDAAAELLRLRKQQLTELDALVKSRFIEMFGSEIDSSVVDLHTICKKITDGTHQPPRFVECGIPFLFVSNIVNNKIVYETSKFITHEDYQSLIKRTPIEMGDILLTIVGSYGNPAVIESLKEFCFQRHIAYLKPNHDEVNSYYLHSAFLCPYVRRQIDEKVKGVAQKTLNLSELKTIKINLPPLTLQNQFADFVQKIEASKALVQKSIDETQALFDSLMSEFFE